jgi:hypothetical protein
VWSWTAGPGTLWGAMENWWTRRRAQRRRRREIARAVRAEFELEPPRGLARIRALMNEVAALEQARMAAHARARERPRPEPAPARRLARR